MGNEREKCQNMNNETHNQFYPKLLTQVLPEQFYKEDYENYFSWSCKVILTAKLSMQIANDLWLS